ncbi:MAG: phosphotransferase [Campylobacterota bacterium]
MGVKTQISLEEVKELFPAFNIQTLIPTSSGVMDTTYLSEEYILKKYEREIDVDSDIKLLKSLSTSLSVGYYISQNRGWFLYKKLQGTQPKTIKTYHIQALARFLAKFHTQTQSMKCGSFFIDKYNLKETLYSVKQNYYFYYKRLQPLQNYKPKNDGFIHGDIFKDNTVFDRDKIGVFDFIDGGCGEFIFDMAVCLVAFDAKKHSLYFMNLFLNTYNQRAPKKIDRDELIKMMEIASAFYALLRIDKYKTTHKARELL